MKRESNKSLINWVEDIWDEIQIQFYGIIGAILLFVLVYLLFHPPWMRPLLDYLYKIFRFSNL